MVMPHNRLSCLSCGITISPFKGCRLKLACSDKSLSSTFKSALTICLLKYLVLVVHITPTPMSCRGRPQGQKGCTPRAPSTRRPFRTRGSSPPCRFCRDHALSRRSLKALKGFPEFLIFLLLFRRRFRQL